MNAERRLYGGMSLVVQHHSHSGGVLRSDRKAILFPSAHNCSNCQFELAYFVSNERRQTYGWIGLDGAQNKKCMLPRFDVFAALIHH
jgi:hypothetical protein